MEAGNSYTQNSQGFPGLLTSITLMILKTQRFHGSVLAWREQGKSAEGFFAYVLLLVFFCFLAFLFSHSLDKGGRIRITFFNSFNSIVTFPYVCQRTGIDMSFVNLLVQQECDFFIGTLGSSWDRLINGLRKTNGKLNSGYVSLNRAGSP